LLLTLVLSLYFNCMLDALEYASSVELKPARIYEYRPAKRTHLSKLLNAVLNNNNGKLDPRYLSIALNESRARIYIHRGDRGRACGVFQIHARYSYPWYQLKTFKQRLHWKQNPNSYKINRECRRLSQPNYSVKVMKSYLKEMDKRNKHACHHNTGIYSNHCDAWYKRRIDIWNAYFSVNNTICKIKEAYNENPWQFDR